MELDPTQEFTKLQNEYVNRSNLVRRDLVEMMRMSDPIFEMHDAAGVIDMIVQTGLIEIDAFYASEGERVVRAMKAGYIIPIEKTHREANPNLIIPALASNYKWKLTQKGKIITNKALTIPYLEVDKVMSSASSYFGDNYATLITDLIEKIELYTKMEPTEDLPKAFIEMSLKILEANLLQLSNANQLTSDMNLAVQREKLTRQFDI